jgi:hypothetical protein
MNVKIPGHIIEAINRMEKQMGTTRTAIFIALLNAGLEQGGARKKK